MMNIRSRTLHDTVAAYHADRDPLVCPLQYAEELRVRFPDENDLFFHFWEAIQRVMTPATPEHRLPTVPAGLLNQQRNQRSTNG